MLNIHADILTFSKSGVSPLFLGFLQIGSSRVGSGVRLLLWTKRKTLQAHKQTYPLRLGGCAWATFARAKRDLGRLFSRVLAPSIRAVFGILLLKEAALVWCVTWLRLLEPDRWFIRWHDMDVWGKVLEILMEMSDYERRMIEASRCSVHPYAGGCQGRKLRHAPQKKRD